MGNRFYIKKGWNDIFSGRMPGINLAVIDESNGEILMRKNFNTHSSGASDYLAITIDRIPQGRIVCIAVSHDGIVRMNDNAKRAIMLLGSAIVHQVGHYWSWALIGYKGAPRGIAIEQTCFPDTTPAHVSDRIHLKPFHRQFVEITAESAGVKAGNYAKITVNNTIIDIMPNGRYYQGLYVVVVNPATGLIKDNIVFDTSADTAAYLASDQFVELIDCLANGTIVAIAIRGEGIRHLSNKAKQACESIGSSMIQHVHHGQSWAIVGIKGAARGSVYLRQQV